MGRAGIAAGRGLSLALPLIGVLAGVVAAHPLSPSLLELRERPDGAVAVRWKTPTLRMPGADLRPLLPAGCRPTAPATIEEEPESITASWTAECGPGGLVGRRIGVEGLDSRITDVLLHLELADGRTVHSVLRPREPSIVVPDRERRLDVARRFVALGIEHIATGYDHLLFVFGLLLLVASTRTLVATITAFTLGHSVTLALAVLDVARVPSATTEALIAASIFVLGVELARPPDAPPTLMRRHPSVLALAFGLLHGLGFAGALREAGLPSEAVPLALLSFNVGIELGQLVFVLAVIVVRRLAAPALRALPSWTRALPIYALGSLAAFWTIERVAVLLPR
jgi:hydrogenase/urease accessory protein HupE